jgi:hypothetical protein
VALPILNIDNSDPGSVYDDATDGVLLAQTDGLMIVRRLRNPNAINLMTVAEQSAITANAKRGSLSDLQALQNTEALKPCWRSRS